MKYILVIFLKEGITKRESTSMQGVDYHTITSALNYLTKYSEQGITDFLVFPSTKNKSVKYACENGIVKDFINKAKTKFGSKIIIHADAGLSPYTENGESVIFENGLIDDKKTYSEVSKLAIAFAKAGADYIAPVIPLKKQVKNVRFKLDKAGFKKTKIHSYSAKFCSALYGPYLDAVQAKTKGHDLKDYYISQNKPEEALSIITNFEKQGADIVMVKPGMLYLDILFRVRRRTKLPLSVYHVSGEYNIIKEASKTNMLNEKLVFDEIHSAFKRAGADYVIGYAPDHYLRWASKNEK